MKSRVHPKYKTKYRVGNWAEYDRALVRRGDVTLWLTPDAIATWAAAGVGRRSGQHDNEVRPHSSLGCLTPAECKAQQRADGDDGGRSPTRLVRADQEEHENGLIMPIGAVLQ